MKTRSGNLSLRLVLLIAVAGLCASLFGNILLYSLNNQINTTLADQKLLVAKNIAFSLDQLSYVPVPGPLSTEEYSNVSIVEISNRHIVYHSQYGRSSVQQLVTLDSTHAKNLTQIDQLFISFGLYADNLNKLVSENRTSNAIESINNYSKNMSDLPTDLGWKLRSAYDTATTDEGELGLAMEETAQIQALLNSMITEETE